MIVDFIIWCFFFHHFVELCCSNYPTFSFYNYTAVMQIISGVENKILSYFVFTDKYATLCKLGCGHFVCTYFQSLELLIAVNKNCRNIMTKPFFFFCKEHQLMTHLLVIILSISSSKLKSIDVLDQRVWFKAHYHDT